MKNYKDQSGCNNCGFVFVRCDFDSCDDFFCTKGAPKRPMSLSISMKDYPDVISEEDCEAWEKWSEDRRVMPWGICDFWKEVFDAKT